METYNSRLVFLDSTNNSTGTGIDASFPVNDTDNFTAQGNSKTMRIGLNTFSMYRNFYNINPSNNKFWVVLRTLITPNYIQEPYVATIQAGDYSHLTYDASCSCLNDTFLDEAITEAIVDVLNVEINPLIPYRAGKKSTQTEGDVECVYNPLLRIFEIFFSNRIPDEQNPVGGRWFHNIYFTSIKPGNQSNRDKSWFVAGRLTSSNLFQDTYQIMGGQTNYNSDVCTADYVVGNFPNFKLEVKEGYEILTATFNMPIVAPGQPTRVARIVIAGYSVAQLSTLDEIVIRTNMPSQNYQSPGVDASVPTNLGLVPTNILARIPIDDTTFDEKRGLIHFIDHNNNFYLMLGSNTLTNIRLTLTDGRGRQLFSLGEDAQQSGNMNFRSTLKIDYIILPDEREKLLLNADRMKLYPMNIGRG